MLSDEDQDSPDEDEWFDDTQNWDKLSGEDDEEYEEEHWVCNSNYDFKWEKPCSAFRAVADENCSVEYWYSSCGPHMCQYTDGTESNSCLADLMDRDNWLENIESFEVWNESNEL